MVSLVRFAGSTQFGSSPSAKRLSLSKIASNRTSSLSPFLFTTCMVILPHLLLVSVRAYLSLFAVGSKVFVHRKPLLDTSEGSSVHDTGLLVLANSLFKEVGLTLHGDHLHPWEWVADIV